MEFLVTMTTRVPEGTSAEAVGDVRAREAAHSRELAAQGSLLRLWRPPLQPGEWRTLGLFAAADDEQLEKTLASMPLRIWRSDEVTPLGTHTNDPAPTANAGVSRYAQTESAQTDTAPPSTEFFTTFTLRIPPDVPRETAAEAVAGEATRTRELAQQGHLVRLWTLPSEPGVPRALGLWRARDDAEMQAMLRSLPLDPWLTVETVPLTQHPSDPAISATSG
jgi:muconolactone delta-isomerase